MAGAANAIVYINKAVAARHGAAGPPDSGVGLNSTLPIASAPLRSTPAAPQHAGGPASSKVGLSAAAEDPS